MNKSSFILFLVLLCTGISRFSEAQNISWALRIGDTGSDQGYDISSDTLGNVYVTGWFSGTVQFGSQTLVSQGLQDIFIASYDGSGNLNWVRQAGGIGNDVSAGIATTPDGITYITGWFADTSHFGDSVVVSNGSYDIFLAKYDAAGVIQWARHGGGPLDDYGNRVALTIGGGVALAGSFKDTIYADGTQLISNGNRDALLSHYSSSGQLVWLKGAGGAGEDRAYGIIQDADSNFFITGLFTGIVDFGTTRLTCNSLFGTYVGKLNPQGDFLWSVKGDGGANDFARGFGIVTDPAGNAVVNGFFSGVLRMGGLTLNANGGQYDQDSYLIKFNTNGNVVWAKNSGGSGTDQGTDLYVSPTGEILETGFFQDSAHFANITIASSGLSDVFVARYDTAGNVIWVAAYGGAGNEYGYGITGNAAGELFITGVLTGSSVFGNQSFVSAGGNDIFIAGLQPSSSSIAVLDDAEQLFVYPNPATDRFLLEMPARGATQQRFAIRITDGSGRTVLVKNDCDTQSPIDVSGLLPGIYFVRFEGRGLVKEARLVVQ